MQEAERERGEDDAGCYTETLRQERLEEATENQLLRERSEGHTEDGYENEGEAVLHQLREGVWRIRRVHRVRDGDHPECGDPAGAGGQDRGDPHRLPPERRPEGPAVLRAENDYQDEEEEDVGDQLLCQDFGRPDGMQTKQREDGANQTVAGEHGRDG